MQGGSYEGEMGKFDEGLMLWIEIHSHHARGQRGCKEKMLCIEIDSQHALKEATLWIELTHTMRRGDKGCRR